MERQDNLKASDASFRKQKLNVSNRSAKKRPDSAKKKHNKSELNSEEQQHSSTPSMTPLLNSEKNNVNLVESESDDSEESQSFEMMQSEILEAQTKLYHL